MGTFSSACSQYPSTYAVLLFPVLKEFRSHELPGVQHGF